MLSWFENHVSNFQWLVALIFAKFWFFTVAPSIACYLCNLNNLSFIKLTPFFSIPEYTGSILTSITSRPSITPASIAGPFYAGLPPKISTRSPFSRTTSTWRAGEIIPFYEWTSWKRPRIRPPSSTASRGRLPFKSFIVSDSLWIWRSFKPFIHALSRLGCATM